MDLAMCAPIMRQQSNTGIESYVVLALVAALPVAFASGFTMYEALKGGILLVGAAAACIAWAVGVARAGSVQVRSVLGMVALLGIVGFALISILWAPNGMDALVASARWLALASVGLALLAPTGKPISLTQLVLAVAVGAGIAGVFGVLDAFGVDLDPNAPGSALDGFRGTFDNDRFGALGLAATVPLLATGVFALRSQVRFVAAAALVPVAVYVGATGQYDAAIMAGGGFVLAAILTGVRRSSALGALGKPAAVLAVALALGVGGYFAAKAATPATFVQVGGKVVESKEPARAKAGPKTPLEVDFGRPTPPRTRGEGFHARTTGWQMFTRHAVGGVGAGNFEVAQVGDLDVSSTWYQTLVSSYPGMRLLGNSGLQLLVELGLIGFLLFVVFIGLVLRSAWLQLAQAQEAQLLGDIGLLASFGSILVGCGVGGVLETTVGVTLLVVTGAAVLVRGAGEGWVLGKDGSALERFGLGLALPVAAAALMLYVGVAATASDYFKARGDVWVNAGSLDRSQEAYQSALGWWAGNDEAALNYAVVTTARSRGFVEEERALLAALELRPYDPRLYKALGQVQVREAVERKKKQRPPKLEGEDGKPDPEAMMKLLDLVDKAVLNKAKANFGRAVELHPRYIDAREAEANAFLLTGEPEKQQTALLKTIDRLGDSDPKRTARLHASLAQSYLGAEDWTRARKHIERALTLDPEHPRRKSMAEDLALIHARESGVKPKKDPHGH
jgi:tetratricopeptide (TPR) repeat protein